MAARRCSTCGISYPLTLSHCGVCGDILDYSAAVEPDKDWGRLVEVALVSRPSPEEARLSKWRKHRLEALGVTGVHLALAAETGIDLHAVEDLIGRGCPPNLAVEIRG